jgi:hypothetical protein
VKTFAFVAPEARTSVREEASPSFSVVIAAFQAAATIAEAVESALAQTVPPLEVIVCDDGSTDDTVGSLRPYRDRIVLLRKENGGEASAKNVAVRAAHGDFVAVLDADDVFLSERLEAFEQLAVARPDLDILTTDAYLEVDGVVVQRCYTDSYRFEVDDQRRAILRENFIFGHVAVRRGRLMSVGGFDESIRSTNDWDCWLRMILEGSRAGLIDEPLSRYRLTQGSLTWNREAHIQSRLATLAKAARRSDLSDAEREIVASATSFNRRAYDVARARAAVLEGRPDARRRAIDVALGRGHGLRTRVKALGTALAPGMARRRLAAKPRETTAGVLLPPSS